MIKETQRQAALDVLTAAVVGYLAVETPEGPYVVPVSFAHDGRFLYWHGGAGKKSRALEESARACLAASLLGEFVHAASPCDDNFNYRSAVVSGTVRLLVADGEREVALRAIIAKYDAERGDDPLTPQVFRRTLVHALEMQEITYKQYPKK
jgi:uncharacterized protein